MTVAFNPITTAGSIAAVTITGVTVRDVDEIPQSGSMVCPILFPQPDGWLSDVAQGPKIITLNDAEGSEFTYNLHYVFLLAEAGSGVGGLDPYNDLIAKLQTIIQTITSDDTLNAAVELTLAGMEGIGVVQDPSNVDYWGALLSFRCVEHP